MNQPFRKKMGRKPGGQPGVLPRLRCIPGRVPDDSGKDPPDRGPAPDKVRLTEYRAYAGVCGCGCRTVADFFLGVDFPVSFSPNIEGLVGYLHARQYLPFSRMQELFNDVMGVGISEGGIHCLLGRFAEKAEPAYRETRRRVAASKVVGTDETGAKVGGERHWFWTWQTPNLTYIAHDPTRGTAAVEANFPPPMASQMPHWSTTAGGPRRGPRRKTTRPARPTC